MWPCAEKSFKDSLPGNQTNCLKQVAKYFLGHITYQCFPYLPLATTYLLVQKANQNSHFCMFRCNFIIWGLFFFFFLRKPLKKFQILQQYIHILIHSKLIFNTYTASSKLGLPLLIYPLRFLLSIFIIKKNWGLFFRSNQQRYSIKKSFLKI